MAIYRGPGGAGDATTDSTSQAIIAVEAAADAEASKVAAAGSATSASNSASAAATSATNAANSASAASTSASGASTSATNAAASASTASTKASEAATSATNAAASASTATTQATNASNSASAAATSATAAATSASAAATSVTNAASSASSALSSKNAAATSETNAASSASAASTSATNAATSATNAANSATSASTSASTATTQATNAANSATAAATSASNAATSATNASNSASAASTSATNASNSASAASTSATNAASSAAAAAASYDDFDDRYLGPKASAPTLDNDGNALQTGALYFNTSTNTMKVYNGSIWLDAYATLSGALIATNNLSDLNNVATARTNLGLGTAALVADNTLVHLAGTETITGAKTFSSNPTISSGTANGVAYLNGSKVLTTGSALTFDGTTLNLGGTGNRITGDFSNATIANRTLLQTNSTNSGSTVSIIPNGTSKVAAIVGYNSSSDPDNSSLCQFGINASETRIQSSKSGAGSYLPMTFYTDGSEQMRLTSTGLGIGTSSPAYKLDVQGGNAQIYQNSATTTYLLTKNSVASSGVAFGALANGAGYIDVIQSNYLMFATNDTERMRIDSSGNLGLGVTPSAWTGNRRALQVDRMALWNAPSEPSLLILSANTYDDGTAKYIANGYASYYRQGSSTHQWFTAPSGTAGNAISFTQAMTLDASGNLGIGTASPTDNLYISRSINAAGGISVVNTNNAQASQIAQLYLQGGDNAYAQVKLQSNSVSSSLRGNNDGSLAFLGGTTERMRIDSSGNVGIGTSSPNAKTEISVASSDAVVNQEVLRISTTGRSAGGGTAGRSAVVSFFDSANATLTGAIGGYRKDSNSDFLGGLKFFYNAGGAASSVSSLTEGMRIDSSGNVGIGTSSPSGKLNVAGSGQLVNLNGGGTNGIYATIGNTGASFICGVQNSAGNGPILSVTGAYDAVIGTQNATNQLFITNNTERMRIDPSGNVGIGTNSPQENLQIGNADGASRSIVIHSANNGNARLRFREGATVSSGYNEYSFGMNGAANAMTWESQGIGEVMVIDSSANLKFNSGYGSAAIAYGCRAWVNFNGTGTIAIRASGNVSSITDGGTGKYTVNLTNAMPDANYGIAITAGTLSGATFTQMKGSQTSSDFVIEITNTTSALVDRDYVYATVFR